MGQDCGAASNKSAWVRSFILAAGVSAFAHDATGGQIYALTGSGGGPDALYSYKGIIYSPLGNLGDSGPIVRFWAKGFSFSYRTSLPGNPNARIKAQGLSFEGEAGWQHAFKNGRLAAYAGVGWRDHFLSIPDPGSDLAKARIFFSGTVDGEWRLNKDFGVMANGQFVSGFNQYWAQIKPFMRIKRDWKVGPDISLNGGKEYRHLNFGAFVSDIKIKIWKLRPFYAGARAGVQWSMKANKFSPYFGVHSGVLF